MCISYKGNPRMDLTSSQPIPPAPTIRILLPLNDSLILDRKEFSINKTKTKIQKLDKILL